MNIVYLTIYLNVLLHKLIVFSCLHYLLEYYNFVNMNDILFSILFLNWLSQVKNIILIFVS